MKPKLSLVRPLTPLFLLLATVVVTTAAARPVHFGLARSVPEDKATVHALPEVRLWFTQAPSEGTVSIRILDAGGQALSAEDPVMDPEDRKVFSVRPRQAPAPGTYTVTWRGMGADGHVVRGTFVFTVAGH